MGSEINFRASKPSLIPTCSRNNYERPARSLTPVPSSMSKPPYYPSSSSSLAVIAKSRSQFNIKRTLLLEGNKEPHEETGNATTATGKESTALLKKSSHPVQFQFSSSPSSISVAELATKFLEETVRKCIKPRIFPMESTSFPCERVPTPFVFTSAGRIHHHRHQRVLGLDSSPTTSLSVLNNASDMDRILQRMAVFRESRSAAAVSTSCLRLAMMSNNMGTNGFSPAKKCQNNQADFASTLKKWSAPIPPILSRKLGRNSDSPLGKVKVMLRVCEIPDEVSGSGILGVDQRRKQVTLIDPGGTTSNGITPEERRVGVSAPKMFAFDEIFGEDDDQAEICSASAAELVASVVGGEDGCLVSLGYCSSGKKQTMFGKPANQKMGAVPTAISWLFKSIQEQKQKTGSRFSVRISAIEVTGGSGHEVINDLLLPFVNDGDQSPGAYLLDSTGSGSRSGKSVNAAPLLNTVSEVRAPNPETAGFYLDAALDSIHSQEDGFSGHFVFTIHVYQYSIDKNGKGVVGGRSRLHCVLLGNGSPSISVLSGLLLAVLNGQRHLPSSNHSKLGAILRECLGSLTCRAVVMIHVTNSHSRYAETLAALQLGSRVHRLRRSRRLKMGSVGSGTGSGGSSGGSGEEMRNGLATSNQVGEGETGSSDIDPSSSEQSCDTVIYLGPSIDEATDGEHPPVYLPSLETTSGENGCETKIVPSKCPLLNGPPPKTKSPKPKSSKQGSDGGSSATGMNTKSEEKWVDGPKVSNAKYRQLQNQIANNGTPSPKKKSETWIDGPAASRVSHQASNFPSPKKVPNLHSHQQQKVMRGGAGFLGSNGSSVDPCCISSTKAEMIQKWISNQTHSPTFFDDISQLDDSFFGGCNGGCNGHQNPHANHVASAGGMGSVFPLTHFSYSDYLYNNHHNGSAEPEYKALTVFKTCDDEDEMRAEEESQPRGNDYEFEFIEVVEPEIPVPTKDVCLQVTEEDIALSFLEEENPLPESDQNFALAADTYFRRGRSTSFSEGPSFSSNSSIKTLDKNDQDHPLRVLSQECLTVVSTFTDSMSIAGGDMERFWPNFTFNGVPMNEIHEMKMCHGLCKNLATLSQMSLDNTNDFPLGCITNDTKNTSPSLSSLSNNAQQENQNWTYEKINPCYKPPTGKTPSFKEPPVLSSDAVFKVPTLPRQKTGSGMYSNHSMNKKFSSAKDSSDAEQESIIIPPMELLDVNQIKNNYNPIENQGQPMPKVQTQCHGQLKPINQHRGCDHNHHILSPNNLNGSLLHTSLVNGNGNNNSGSGESTHSISTITSPASPSPVIPILITEATSKSPSKSKSRKLSKFFSSRSKSPKKVVTSSSESGKSSGSSTDTKHSSSSSSCSSGISLSNTKPKMHSSPKHQSPSKKVYVNGSSCLTGNNAPQISDYHFTCDSALPMFVPSPTSKGQCLIENGNSKVIPNGDDKIKSK